MNKTHIILYLFNDCENSNDYNDYNFLRMMIIVYDMNNNTTEI